jgi:hypothetical protein
MYIYSFFVCGATYVYGLHVHYTDVASYVFNLLYIYITIYTYNYITGYIIAISLLHRLINPPAMYIHLLYMYVVMKRHDRNKDTDNFFLVTKGAATPKFDS